MAEQTNKRLTFEINIQFHNRFTIPPPIMKMAKLKQGDTVEITLEKTGVQT